MSGREFLKQYDTAKAKLETAEAELHRVEELIDSIQIDLSGMPKATSNATKTERYVIQLMKARDDYQTAKEHYEYIRHRVVQVINSLDNSTSVDLLRYRVLDDMRWADIAKKMNYSVYYVSKDLYRKALREIEKVIIF